MALLSGVAQPEILKQFGLVIEEVDVFNRILLRYLDNRIGDAVSKLRRIERIGTLERHAYRRLFVDIVRSVESMSQEDAGDFRLFLENVKRFRSPGEWPTDAKNAVHRIIAAARAGAAHLQTREIPHEREVQATYVITWAIRRDGVDMNAFWVITVTLALLRARALFRLGCVNI